jgi:hypothetical protein
MVDTMVEAVFETVEQFIHESIFKDRIKVLKNADGSLTLKEAELETSKS